MASRANSAGSTNSSVDDESVDADDDEDDETDDGVYVGYERDSPSPICSMHRPLLLLQ